MKTCISYRHSYYKANYKQSLTELCCFRYSAAFSSALPPISPIRMIPSVFGSLKNTSRQSMKLVPLKGSPPIPEKKKKLLTSLENWQEKLCLHSDLLHPFLVQSTNTHGFTRLTSKTGSLTNTERLSQANLCGLMHCFIREGARPGDNACKRQTKGWTSELADRNMHTHPKDTLDANISPRQKSSELPTYLGIGICLCYTALYAVFLQRHQSIFSYKIHSSPHSYLNKKESVYSSRWNTNFLKPDAYSFTFIYFFYGSFWLQ